MKSSLALSAVLATVVASSAVAAEGSKTPTTDTTAAAKPHSHMMEKTGMPASKEAASPADGKTSASKEKIKHLHPRDGK